MSTKKKICKVDISELDTTNKFLVDWISFSTSAYDVYQVIELLGLQEVKFTEIAGCHGYTRRKYFDGININYAPSNFTNNGKESYISRDENSVWVEMSGQGCRVFETFSSISFDDLFRIFYNDLHGNTVNLNNYYGGNSYLNPYRQPKKGREVVTEKPVFCFNRLDIAYDCFTGEIPLEQLAYQVRKFDTVSKFRSNGVIYSPVESVGMEGITCELGSMRSDVFFRVYDKAMEKKYYDEIKSMGFSWVRWEAQLRHERVGYFINEYINHENSLGTVFKGILSNYFRPVERNENESNKSRWATSQWYLDFIGNVKKIGMFTKCTTEYNLEKCERFVYRQANNAVNTIIKIKGIDKFREELEENAPDNLPAKYQRLIDESKQYINKSSEDKKIRKVVSLANYICLLRIFTEKFGKFNDDTAFCRPELYESIKYLSGKAYFNACSDFNETFSSLTANNQEKYDNLLTVNKVNCDEDDVFYSYLKSFSSELLVDETHFRHIDTGEVLEETGEILKYI